MWEWNCSRVIHLLNKHVWTPAVCETRGVGWQNSSSPIVGKLSHTIPSSGGTAIFTIKILRSFHTYCYNKEEEEIFNHVQDRGWEIQGTGTWSLLRAFNTVTDEGIPKNTRLCLCMYIKSLNWWLYLYLYRYVSYVCIYTHIHSSTKYFTYLCVKLLTW